MKLFKNLSAVAKKAVDAVRGVVVHVDKRLKDTRAVLQRDLFPPPPKKPAAKAGKIAAKPRPAKKPLTVDQAFAKAEKRITQIAKRGKDQVTQKAKAAETRFTEVESYGHEQINKCVGATRNALSNAQSGFQALVVKRKTASVARVTFERVAENVLDSSTQLYLNSGGWNEDTSDFGVICGRYVMLGSWLDGPGTRRALPKDIVKTAQAEDQPAIEKLAAILNPPGRDDAAYCVRAVRCQKAVAPRDKPLVFIGDLHLHLFRHSSLDAFKRNRSLWQKLTGRHPSTLEEELAAFLKHVVDEGATVVQTGDLWECWEAHALLDEACRDYEDAVMAQPEQRPSTGIPVPQPCPAPISPLLAIAEKGGLPIARPTSGTKDEQRKRLREAFRSKASARLAAELLKFSWYPAIDVPGDDDPLDLVDSNQIRDAIKKRYPKLRLLGSCELIRGNHDNGLELSRLKERYGAFIELRGKPPASRRYGERACVVTEHGHRLDGYNSDLLGGKPAYNSGYQMVERNMATRERFEFLASLPMFDSVGRATQACAKDLAGSTTNRLIVLGHSHSAKLLEVEVHRVAPQMDEASTSVLV